LKLDIHSHFYAPGYVKLMVDLGREDLRRMPTQSSDLSDLVAEQDRVGIDCQVLSFGGVNAILEDRSAAHEAAACLNDAYQQVCAAHDGRFRAFAMLPLPHVESALQEAERMLGEPSVVGVSVPCSVSGMPLDDPALEELWAGLNDRATTVYVHPVGQDSQGHWGLEQFGLSAMFGSPLQLGVAACRIVFSGMLQRFPKLQFVFAQCGGFLAARWEAIENIVLRPGLAGHAPYMLGWVNSLALDASDPMAGFRQLYFDTSGIYHTPGAIAEARHSYGVDRLVLGSDTRFMSLTDTVSFIADTDLLTAPEKSGILERGAALLSTDI
jgi:predicted TIM-barrel fold metal-dependent hydrolase